ncbi:MAG TPA: inositol monophosphatase [Dehalococcoidia bacterium]|nr:inositol monophosphatase [Dehalococcoidia bacterium]
MTQLPLSQSGRTAFQVAVEAAHSAGDILLSHFYSKKEFRRKGPGNIVTEVDLLSERAMSELLRREYPDFGLIGEESEDRAGQSGYSWVIDPLDGTNNYTFGIPLFAVTVCLIKGEEALLGLTYAPLQQELFHAQKGQGAFLNDVPITVSQRDRLEHSLIGFDMGYDRQRGFQYLELARRLWPGVHSLRLIGSASLGLAYVAAGRMDLYFHRCVYPWDIASGLLLVTEAGGIVSNWGQPITLRSRSIIAGSPAIYRQFWEKAQEYAWPP